MRGWWIVVGGFFCCRQAHRKVVGAIRTDRKNLELTLAFPLILQYYPPMTLLRPCVARCLQPFGRISAAQRSIQPLSKQYEMRRAFDSVISYG